MSSATSARVDLEIDSNATWQDAFQFTPPTGYTWDFNNKTFHMDVKASNEDATALLSLTTANGRIVVDDATNRVLHFNVTEDDLAALNAGCYVYDLVMLDNSAPAVRTPLMHGTVKVDQGVTLS